MQVLHYSEKWKQISILLAKVYQSDVFYCSFSSVFLFFYFIFISIVGGLFFNKFQQFLQFHHEFQPGHGQMNIVEEYKIIICSNALTGDNFYNGYINK